MSALLLAVIYLVFISLGLPDSLIGSSWPVISAELQVDEGMQGGGDHNRLGRDDNKLLRHRLAK